MTRGGQQVPWESSSITGDFYFWPQSQVASVIPTPENPPDPIKESTALTDTQTWQTIADSQNPNDYIDFLARFPDSVLVAYANARLRQLTSTLEPLQLSKSTRQGSGNGNINQPPPAPVIINNKKADGDAQASGQASESQPPEVPVSDHQTAADVQPHGNKKTKFALVAPQSGTPAKEPEAGNSGLGNSTSVAGPLSGSWKGQYLYGLHAELSTWTLHIEHQDDAQFTASLEVDGQLDRAIPYDGCSAKLVGTTKKKNLFIYVPSGEHDCAEFPMTGQLRYRGNPESAHELSFRIRFPISFGSQSGMVKLKRIT